MYFVIEKFPKPFVISDVEGNVKYFDTIEEALTEVDDCQDGILIEL